MTYVTIAGTIAARLACGLLMIVLITACTTGSDSPEPPEASIVVSTGSFSTTVRHGDEADIPFSQTVLIDVEFQEEIYDSAGRTFADAETEPNDWRVTRRQPENRRTYSFAIRNQEPGTVTVSVYMDRDAVPVEFTLHIGSDEG